MSSNTKRPITRLLRTPKLGLILSFLLAITGSLGVVGLFIHQSGRVAVGTIATGDNTPPAYSVFSNLALHDSSVMQSFAYDSNNKVWIFAQVTSSGRLGETHSKHAADGDLTLTKVSSAGKVLGYMYLNGFGHGLSIGVEPVGSTTYVWTESYAKSIPALGSAVAGTYGTKIARFAWRNSATISPTTNGVVNYGSNAGQPAQSPSVDYKHNRIAIQYYSPTLQTFRWAIYPLDQYKKHVYSPLARVSWPTELNALTDQGWTFVSDQTIANLNGNGYDSVNNPPPGNTTIFNVTITPTSATISNQYLDTVGSTLPFREPEGLSNIDGNLCMGFAAGEGGARKANVYCQTSYQ